MASWKDRADTLRMEFDPRHPKVRMTLIAYLGEAGVVPSNYDTVDEYVSMVDTLLTYIGKDAHGFFEMLEGFDPDVEDDGQMELGLPEGKSLDFKGGAYL